MKNWEELGQSILIGMIFSFLVAKLISILLQFKHDNLKLIRQDSETDSIESESEENKSLIDDNSEDEWEKSIEKCYLDEDFTSATAFIASTAVNDDFSKRVSKEVQLELYGLYKIATHGPCDIPRPSSLQLSNRAKWNAWQRLGTMSAEEAMQNYIILVTELFPFWATSENKGGENDGVKIVAKQAMGPVFSTFIHEDSDDQVHLHTIHASSREGEVDDLLKSIDSGISVNLRDSEGRTPLHWAVDRGHLEAVQLLVSKNADVNAMDNEGQTPLHYAATCEREGIAEFLVSHGAETVLKDNDGISPCDLLSNLNWPCIHDSSLAA